MLRWCATALFAFGFWCASVRAQSVPFTLQTYQDSPISLLSITATVFRADGGRREFVKLTNRSDKAISGLLFQETMPDGSRTQIVALEQISVIFRPRETKRLSINVEDVWNRVHNAAKSGATPGKPVLSVVGVEFIDGSIWSAPVDRAGT